MRARDVRRRETADLLQEIGRLREEIFQQRFHGQSEEKVDRGKICRDRRNIARIKTIVHERARGINIGLDAVKKQPVSKKKGS